jgi:hypothetical protein
MSSPHSATRANRNRVLEFERESQERLAGLQEIEESILSVGQLRSRWLLGVSNIDEVETESFRIKLDYLKAQSELAALNLQVDKVTLEGHYENQTLNFLINATRPLDSGETKEMRAKSLDALARENLDDLSASLRSSCDARAKLAREMHTSTLQLSKLRSNNDNRHTSVVNELQDKIGAYAERMKEAVITSKKSHQKITGEYLILRHNARAAKEVLLRSQNEAAMARKILQEKLDRMIEEATIQRERMEVGAVAELKVMTEDVRNAVIRKEAEANDLRRSIQGLEKERKQTTRMMKTSIKSYNKKYDMLNAKRNAEIDTVKHDLEHLRAMVNRVELELRDDKQSMMSPNGENAEVYTVFRAMTQLETPHTRRMLV